MLNYYVKKGFTFEQLAIVLLVILGLIILVIMISSQARQAGSGVSEIGEGISSNIGDVTSSINDCVGGQNGECLSSAECNTQGGVSIGTLDCDSGICCIGTND